MASIPCAIELEPKTLNPIQLNHARELAVVIQKIDDSEEDPSLPIQELQSMKSMEDLGLINEGHNGNLDVNNMIDESNNNNNDDINNVVTTTTRPHNCLCAKLFIDSPDEIIQKEPVTAPF